MGEGTKQFKQKEKTKKTKKVPNKIWKKLLSSFAQIL